MYTFKKFVSQVEEFLDTWTPRIAKTAAFFSAAKSLLKLASEFIRSDAFQALSRRCKDFVLFVRESLRFELENTHCPIGITSPHARWSLNLAIVQHNNLLFGGALRVF